MAVSFTASLLKSSHKFLTQAARQASTLKANERLWRSFFYVPGDQEKKISKVAALCDTHQIDPSIPDVVVLDCEDAVSAANKVALSRVIISTLLMLI